MRDIVIAIMVIGAMVGTFEYLDRTGHLLPDIGKPGDLVVAHHRAKAPLPSLSKPHHNQGDLHGKDANRVDNQQAQDHGKDEGAADDSAEIENIASIYQRKRPSERVAEGGEARSEARAKPTFVHGVPIEAWVSSHQDSLPQPVADGGQASGIRVFLECMEMKKDGPEALKQKECEKILEAESKNALAYQVGRRDPSPTDVYR